MAAKEVRLHEAVTAAVDRHEKVNEEYERVIEKVENLKMLRQDVVMTDEEMIDLVKDIDGMKVKIEKSKNDMKGATSAFRGAHSVTLEVLGSADEVKFTDGRFSWKGPREVKCMFCNMEFDGHELCRKCILRYHWHEVQIEVSIHVII